MTNKTSRTIRIFDTTLRDGEQTPGVSLTADDKIEIARQLSKLGVDVIEAGFPSSSEGERKVVKDIAKLGLTSEICALSRATRKDIDAALACDVRFNPCLHPDLSSPNEICRQLDRGAGVSFSGGLD